jgi:2-methylisocitrate lyase-like PEP mutase family enzyme
MTLIDKTQHFRSLHIAGHPLVLYNIWDAGSALAVVSAGAKAIATSSWSVAAAQGYLDGERLPLELALAVVKQIVATVDVPVTVDFEGGYAAEPETVGYNVSRLLALSVSGLNIEDQIVGTSGLYSVADQMARLRSVREAADALNLPTFINARTDLFLKAAPDVHHADLIDEALARQAAYTEAGADGFFVPGLTDTRLIAQICKAAILPVNVMMTADPERVKAVAALGVSRISFGPSPYLAMISALSKEATALG